ncbi:MAG TPA: hypothetical protein P5295_08135 [Spirochaetota bacterium]|nr:hypothetical protein [Spirochaetota bacterium]
MRSIKTKKLLRLIVSATAVLLMITGCDDSGVEVSDSTAVQAGDTSVLADTGSETLSAADTRPEFPVRMGDAENLLFTDTGRIFVTGANVAEITPDGAAMLMPDNYGIFGGMAQVGSWLYVICNRYRTSMDSIDLNEMLKAENLGTLLGLLTDAFMDKVILRADLNAGGPEKLVFTEIHRLTGMMLANGMTADSKGNLYVADMTFLPAGKIVKVSVSETAIQVATQETWLSSGEGVHSPNGMCIRDDILYFTDYNMLSSKQASVKKVTIIGDSPGAVETLHSAAGLYDDLDVVVYRGRPTVAVAGYFVGNILVIDEETGNVTRVGSSTLQCPSSVHFGDGGWVGTDEFIVTEVGMLYEPYSSYGNRVSILDIPE